jgi:hypothetical protein
MQKIINLNKNPFLRDRLIFSVVLITLLCAYVVYQLSIFAGGWFQLHQQSLSILFIELFPVLLIGVLLFITSARYQEEKKISFEESRTHLIQNIASTIDKIKTGNFNKETDITGEEMVDNALKEIYEKFKAEADEERHRSWGNEGLAMFRQVMSSHSQIKPMCEDMIAKIVKYVKAAQGGIFILNDAKELELMACYAFERKKYITKTLLPGEGLVGQCFIEAHRIYMTKVPHEYVRITSGLGGATPDCVLIIPLKLKDETLGVLELASFKPFKPYQLDFMDKAAEALAQTSS